MKRCLRVALLALVCACPAFAQPIPETTTVILVRHAEQTAPEGDMPLTPQGRVRAHALAQLLRDTKLRAIITSQFIRTKETAELTAKQSQIAPDVLPANDLDAVVAKVRSFGGGTVLVVHHSNTVPVLTEKFGGLTPPIAHDEFDRLVIVTMPAGGNSTTLTLRYGAPSGR